MAAEGGADVTEIRQRWDRTRKFGGSTPGARRYVEDVGRLLVENAELREEVKTAQALHEARCPFPHLLEESEKRNNRLLAVAEAAELFMAVAVVQEQDLPVLRDLRAALSTADDPARRCTCADPAYPATGVAFKPWSRCPVHPRDPARNEAKERT